MIHVLMNKKRGLNRFSKLLDDGDPWAPNNLLKPGAKKKKKKKKTPVEPCRQEAPAPTTYICKMNSLKLGPSWSRTPDPPACNKRTQHSYLP